MPGTLNVGGHNIITHSGTSGAGTINLVDQAGNTILTDSGSGMSLSSNVAFPSGHVIKTEMSSQISGSTSSTSNVTIASPSFTTTVANSKVYIMMTLCCRISSASFTGNGFIYVRFVHGASVLLDGYPIVGSNGATDERGVAAWNYLYSPNVAAGTTLNFDVTINANYATTVYIDSDTDPSHITFMEIAP